MKPSRGMLEGQLAEYEEQLRSLRSYIKELKDRTAEHGTSEEHFGADLMEAEHNVQYYESEVARIRGEMSATPKAERAPSGAYGMLPSTTRQGIGSLILTAIGFIAGALIGSRLNSRGGRRDGE